MKPMDRDFAAGMMADSRDQHVREEARREITLRAALEESVKLQSHYAGLLNQFDGGQRMQFPSAEAWIARLKEIATK